MNGLKLIKKILALGQSGITNYIHKMKMKKKSRSNKRKSMETRDEGWTNRANANADTPTPISCVSICKPFLSLPFDSDHHSNISNYNHHQYPQQQYGILSF